MKIFFIASALFFNLSSFASDSFPTTPDPNITPGSLCQSHEKLRYPEQISYCSRNVSYERKREIIKTYDATFGYNIEKMDRKKFKIDHYIPLCMGGSNEDNNLWPQHESVFIQTDHLEELSCQKMAEGKLLQKTAIQIMIEAKTHLTEAARLTQYVKNL